MTKTRIEICIICARGLGRSPSLLKPQWFAVGWIDPNSKYCTKIYSSGNRNPTWKTKFIFDVDDRSSNLQDLSLTVEIHKREPIFLRDKLHGTANIMLKEFFAKFSRETDAFRTGFEEAGSFQLRKKNSGRPKGFVDISVNISKDRGVASHSGRNGFHYTDQRNNIALAVEDGPVLSYPTHSQAQPPPQFDDYYYSYPYGRQLPQLPPSPSPSPQPPSNSGLLPTLPARSRTRPLESYVNLPASGNAGTSSGFGVGMGLGAGTLAAAAMIFGDDFMSGMSFPAGLDGGSLTVSTNPPF